MTMYKYEVVFTYDTTWIGTTVWVSNDDPKTIVEAAVVNVWETNGIDIPAETQNATIKLINKLEDYS